MAVDLDSAAIHEVRHGKPSVGAVAEDEIRRRRLSSLLGSSGLEVVAQAPTPTELVEGHGRPVLDVVILAADVLDPESVGLLKERYPATRIIYVGAETDRRTVREALEAGVDGFVREAQLEACLVLAVRAVCSGQLVLPRDFREYVAKPAMSAREKQVLGMVVLGFTNGEIAAKLHLAESTVKSHLSSIFAKLGVRSRHEATSLILDSEGGLGTGVLAISDDRPRGL